MSGETCEDDLGWGLTAISDAMASVMAPAMLSRCRVPHYAS
jgi:hypothetical protein